MKRDQLTILVQDFARGQNTLFKLLQDLHALHKEATKSNHKASPETQATILLGEAVCCCGLLLATDLQLKLVKEEDNLPLIALPN